MQVKVYSRNGESTGKMKLPSIPGPVRVDLVSQLYRSATLSVRAPYGTKRSAGLRNVGHNMGANHGRSRIPRVAGGNRGVILASMVGGRSAHAPVVAKNLIVSMNSKERIVARKSAILMTFDHAAVSRRGHNIPEDLEFPIVAKDEIQDISKTSEAMEFLEKIGLSDDLDRAKNGKKVRAGRGKMRGRKYKGKKSVLVVGTDSRKLSAFSSLPGVDVASVSSLGITKLAPGGKPGRLTVYTESAMKEIIEVLQ
ncbi:MAG: 50S ribosomal protein L4 [Candidatus Thermoplasmatota archaeon]|jgi:large subunit ribosomal protein L4e|nr:50S ribosomal protein L4 [Candidatus Thermoplasmatota archaeon]MCL5786203.1 50S ribosomal protein L4 [Candidatus Thermoplasmatota archaeon]